MSSGIGIIKSVLLGLEALCDVEAMGVSIGFQILMIARMVDAIITIK
jgi:hypothetical protein